MKSLRIVQTAPHVHKDGSVSGMMLDLCIALLPALVWGIYVFGLRAAVILLLSVFFTLGFEALWQFLWKKPFTLKNLSALAEGLILAMLLPVSVPLYLVPVGAFLTVIAGKAVFGGLGKNPLNPAVLAKAILLLLFPLHLTRYTLPFAELSPWKLRFSAEALEPHLARSTLDSLRDGTERLDHLFTGCVPGAIGEGSALLLLLGLIYLLVRKTVTWHVPVSFLATVSIATFLLPTESNPFEFMLRYLLSGGLIFAAGFLATDPVTSPATRKGRVVYGVICGVLTVLARQFLGGESALLAILVANLSVWSLDHLLRPRPYGTRRFRKRPDVTPLAVVWFRKFIRCCKKALPVFKTCYAKAAAAAKAIWAKTKAFAQKLWARIKALTEKIKSKK